MFSKLLMCDIYSHDALRESNIILEDPNEESLDLTYRLANKIIDKFNLPGKIYKTTSQKEALKGADFVISMIAVGGSEAWALDKSIPLNMGLTR